MQNAANEKTTDLEVRISKLEAQVQSITYRNSRVEAEKAWETSNVRRLSIVTITYIMMALLLFVIGVSNPWLNAVIPTLGYYLSTLYLRHVKEVWIKKDKDHV